MNDENVKFDISGGLKRASLVQVIIQNPWMERLYLDPRWFRCEEGFGQGPFYRLFWGPAVGATWYITVGRHPRLVLQQSSKRGGIPNNPRPILVVGRTKSLWGISSLLTSNLALYLFWISCLLLDVKIVFVYWTGKRGRGVCVYWAF